MSCLTWYDQGLRSGRKAKLHFGWRKCLYEGIEIGLVFGEGALVWWIWSPFVANPCGADGAIETSGNEVVKGGREESCHFQSEPRCSGRLGGHWDPAN